MRDQGRMQGGGDGMDRKKVDTVGEILYWSSANLAMGDAALQKRAASYGRVHFMIRAKLYRGLRDGTISPRSLYHDEREKLLSGGRCSYCGGRDHPSLDHLFP